MLKIRFQKIRNFFKKYFCDPNVKDEDPWWHIMGRVIQYNEIRKNAFTHVPVVVLDNAVLQVRLEYNDNKE